MVEVHTALYRVRDDHIGDRLTSPWHVSLVFASNDQLEEVWFGEHGVDIVKHDPEIGNWTRGIPLLSRIRCGEIKASFASVMQMMNVLAGQWACRTFHRLEPKCQDFVGAVLAVLRLRPLPRCIWHPSKTSTDHIASPCVVNGGQTQPGSSSCTTISRGDIDISVSVTSESETPRVGSTSSLGLFDSCAFNLGVKEDALDFPGWTHRTPRSLRNHPIPSHRHVGSSLPQGETVQPSARGRLPSANSLLASCRIHSNTSLERRGSALSSSRLTVLPWRESSRGERSESPIATPLISCLPENAPAPLCGSGMQRLKTCMPGCSIERSPRTTPLKFVSQSLCDRITQQHGSPKKIVEVMPQTSKTSFQPEARPAGSPQVIYSPNATRTLPYNSPRPTSPWRSHRGAAPLLWASSQPQLRESLSNLPVTATQKRPCIVRSDGHV